MMKWCTFCYNSKSQSAVPAEYNVFFVLVWLDVLWAMLCDKFSSWGKIKRGPYPALTYIRLAANPKVKLWVQKGAGKLQSRMAEKLKYKFLLSVARLPSVEEKSFNCCFYLFLKEFFLKCC